MKIFVYNETGKGHFEFKNDDYELQDNEMLVEGVCEFREPKRNMTTGELEESMDSHLIFDKTKESMLLEITECCKHLTDRALISSVSKEGDVEFLKGQAERYRNKYNVAKQYCLNQTISNQSWYDAIVLEMNNTNTELGLVGTDYELTVSSFMTLIKEAFELGLTRSEKFEPNIEVFRCKTKDLVLSGQFQRAKQMLEYAYSLPIQLDLSDVDTFMNDINSI